MPGISLTADNISEVIHADDESPTINKLMTKFAKWPWIRVVETDEQLGMKLTIDDIVQI